MFSLLLQVYKTRSRLLLDTDLLNDIEADLSDLITNCILEIIIITFLVTLSLWMPTSHDGLYQGVGDWNLRRFELSEQNCSSSRPAELGHNGTTGSQQSLCILTFLQESEQITSMCSTSFNLSHAQLICSQQFNVYLTFSLILKQLTLCGERGDVLPLRSPED